MLWIREPLELIHIELQEHISIELHQPIDIELQGRIDIILADSDRSEWSKQ
jgi:hypothetical protein